jgi:hypothetical protein
VLEILNAFDLTAEDVAQRSLRLLPLDQLRNVAKPAYTQDIFLVASGALSILSPDLDQDPSREVVAVSDAAGASIELDGAGTLGIEILVPEPSKLAIELTALLVLAVLVWSRSSLLMTSESPLTERGREGHQPHADDPDRLKATDAHLCFEHVVHQSHEIFVADLRLAGFVEIVQFRVVVVELLAGVAYLVLAELDVGIQHLADQAVSIASPERVSITGVITQCSEFANTIRFHEIRTVSGRLGPAREGGEREEGQRRNDEQTRHHFIHRHL